MIAPTPPPPGPTRTGDASAPFRLPASRLRILLRYFRIGTPADRSQRCPASPGARRRRTGVRLDRPGTRFDALGARPARTGARLGRAGAALLAVLLVPLLAACGGGPSPVGAPPAGTGSSVGATPAPSVPTPDTAAPGTADPGTAAPGAGGPNPVAAPVWPVRDLDAATRLQRDVDDGRQPWLLDPVEVATAYAGAELGYRDPRGAPSGIGVVGVRDGAGAGTATVTLTQPVRPGAGGIWVVTDVRRK